MATKKKLINFVTTIITALIDWLTALLNWISSDRNQARIGTLINRVNFEQLRQRVAVLSNAVFRWVSGKNGLRNNKPAMICLVL